eukprot:TRINITY_DN14225_c0_g1_i1.p1 TRINITY_DN14225_c0_g1~~TRINITY_DN14225_c0_g1_i1.p1  ORF type:complete len:349 (+),score=15.82 TRINITY_DN14225_c0_g1_i1:2-1048(+)
MHDVVIQQCATIIDKASCTGIHAHHCMRDVQAYTRADRQVIELDTVLFIGWFADNLYHVLADSFGKILALQQLGLMSSDIMILWGPKDLQVVQQLQALFGVTAQSRHCSYFEQYVIKTLYYVDSRAPQFAAEIPQTTPAMDLKQFTPSKRWSTLEYAALSSRYGQVAPTATGLMDVKTAAFVGRSKLILKSNKNYVLWISRGDTGFRTVHNEDVLLKNMDRFLQEKHNLELVIHTNNHTDLDVQIEMFNQAAVIVAPHGAGLANVFWMRTGSAMIEFPIPFALKNTDYQHLCTVFGVKHYTVPSIRPNKVENRSYMITSETIRDVLEVLDLALKEVDWGILSPNKTPD